MTGGVGVTDGGDDEVAREVLEEGNHVLEGRAVATSAVSSLTESLKRTDLPEVRRAAVGPLLASSAEDGSSAAPLTAVDG